MVLVETLQKALAAHKNHHVYQDCYHWEVVCRKSSAFRLFNLELGWIVILLFLLVTLLRRFGPWFLILDRSLLIIIRRLFEQFLIESVSSGALLLVDISLAPLNHGFIILRFKWLELHLDHKLIIILIKSSII